MTTYWIGKTKVPLGEGDLLGAGGEGTVYAWRDRAVKILHATAEGDDAARAKVALAFDKVRAFPRGLPSAVVAPLELVADGKGRAAGFTMHRVAGAAEVARLTSRRYREGVVSNAEVLALFTRIHAVVSTLHARGVVLGDFNDGNVLFRGLDPFFIDADSMQFDGFPCAVAHERYLDPALYGRDLAARPSFTPGSDWYAFAVMLFTSLLYVHPYGGTHKTWTTMLRRAEAGHSVLRADVVYPKAASPFAILPDDLLAAFAAVFDGKERAPFPAALLGARWVRCACGVEHARRACPVCAEAARVQVSAAVVAGGCVAVTIVRTRGRILAASVQGGRLLWAIEEEGAILREDGTHVRVGALPLGARVALSGKTTWLARDGRLARLAVGAGHARDAAPPLEEVTSMSAFDADAGGGFAVVNGWITDLARGTRVGQVLEGQTWLAVGAAMGVGFYRTGSITEAFVFHVGRGGVSRVALPKAAAVGARDRIVDVAASFDGETALLTLALDRAGRRLHALYLVRADGSVVASAIGAPDESPLFAPVRGRCIAGGAVLTPSDDGLLLARADARTGALAAEKTFPDTRSFVCEGAELLPAPGGSVYLVTPKEITHLRLG